ncbi:MAG: hypothetical protein ACT4TC_11380 [Myxococcaceae bacterium]
MGRQPAASLVATVYDVVDNSFITVTSSGPSRDSQVAALLPDGSVLLAGGTGASGAVANVDIFDEGRGALAAYTPVLSSISASGTSVSLLGRHFFGHNAGGGGNALSTQTNFPLLVFRSVENGETTLIPTADWTDVSATATLPATLKTGMYRASVVVNGVASSSQFFTYAAAASRLVYATPPRTLVRDACGAAAAVIIVQLQDANGYGVSAGAAGQPFSMQSTSTGGAFFIDPSCTTAASGGSFVIPARISIVRIYYRDSVTGTPTVSTLNGSGLSNASQAATIQPDAVAPVDGGTPAANPSATLEHRSLAVGCACTALEGPLSACLIALLATARRRRPRSC